MLRLSQLKLPVTHTEAELEHAIIKKARGHKLLSWQIRKRSVDARKKPEIYYIYTIDASLENEKKLLGGKSPWTKPDDVKYRFPYQLDEDQTDLVLPPVIVGEGPAGLFAGLMLARAGFCPIIFERGESVENRTERVEAFFEGAALDPESNVQFGEGGAGTFSDGKLNTVVKDKYGRNRYVLEEFVRHGAPENILYDAKPHIGTDVLKHVVASMREEILAHGGEIHFNTRVTGIIRSERGPVIGVRTRTVLRGKKTSELPEMEWPCSALILAIGHSARDTFAMLYDSGLSMKQKAFAMGVRVEHPAGMINVSQYGEEYPDVLPTADYKLTHQCKNGRGVYSFCMCPGGYVVNSSSEPGRICVNGMSYHGRDAANSNSAIITTVTPDDFPSEHPLAGLALQRTCEELAYRCGNGKIPVQLYGDLKAGRVSSGFGTFLPCMKGAYHFADLRECLPDYVVESLLEGMEAFGRKIDGYDREDAILSGVESRTSSPIRMERDENCMSNIPGLYPCGEGAGYAGGITSAAMDGIKVAENVAAKLLNR